MGHNKVLNQFFEEPNRLYMIREIAKITGIPKTTVSRKLKQLVKDKMVIKKKEAVEGYKANEDMPGFRFKKKISFLERLNESGLISYLNEIFNPRCIILFGSFSKGEYIKGSDIDIFVQAHNKDYNMVKFEKKLDHTINILFEEDINKLSDELFNNIINGIKLRGYIKIR